MSILYDNIYKNNPNYSSNSAHGSKYPYVLNFTNNFKGKILDAGCGDGWYLKKLILDRRDVFGIDSSQYCCDTFLKKLPHECIDIVSFAERKAHYEAVICMDVLEHIKYTAIDNLLKIIKTISNNFLFGIANHSDIFGGVQLHLIQENSYWWEEKIKNSGYELIGTNILLDGRFFFIECINIPY